MRRQCQRNILSSYDSLAGRVFRTARRGLLLLVQLDVDTQ